MDNTIDVLEDTLNNISPDLLNALLKDHTRSTKDNQQNIFFATSDYESLGEGYGYKSPITPELITGEHGNVIQPRVLKRCDLQTSRTKDKAEVFTPSWVCNAQNNMIDEAWFGRKDAFNKELPDHTWEDNPDRIEFPEGKSWRDYVRDVRLEITCGEAPYMASRYDTTTAEPIPLQHRIGMLDRKLRVVGENTEKSEDWLKWAQEAFKSCYGYEWQGDSLLIARKNMLYSFIDYYQAKFGRMPQTKSLLYIAYIVSWNFWQMDGLKGVVPGSCKLEATQTGLFGAKQDICPCEGCATGDIKQHKGDRCQIKDWRAVDKETGKRGKRIEFIDLIK